MTDTAINIEEKANDALETLVRRFTSSNSIDVERSTIKKDEFDDILTYIAYLKQSQES